MDNKTLPGKETHSAERRQVLFVDGCKVTVKYSEQKNPAVARTIKDALLVGGAVLVKG